jgi:hypothetical protein
MQRHLSDTTFAGAISFEKILVVGANHLFIAALAPRLRV